MTSILIVEDDITYGMMLKTWLGKKGFQVTSASNIARAQKHIESETVDLILSDLRLPDKDGIDLLKWLGEHGLQIPLIIMTGYADIQSAVQTMKLGACDYIAKPVNPDELLKKIGEALNASSSALKQMMHSSRTDDAFTPNRPSVSPKQTMHSDKMKNQPLKGAEGSLSSSDFLEGESDAAKQLYNYVKLVSPTHQWCQRNGQRIRSSPHPPAQQACRPAVCSHRLRFYSQRIGRFGVLRAHKGRLYRRTDRQNGRFRRSQRRYHLPG